MCSYSIVAYIKMFSNFSLRFLWSFYFWHVINGLCMKPEKSEGILFGIQSVWQTSNNYTIADLNLANANINIGLSCHITSLGITSLRLVFDYKSSILPKRLGFLYIRHALTEYDMAETLAVSGIQSRLEYCNSASRDFYRHYHWARDFGTWHLALFYRTRLAHPQICCQDYTINCLKAYWFQDF